MQDIPIPPNTVEIPSLEDTFCEMAPKHTVMRNASIIDIFAYFLGYGACGYQTIRTAIRSAANNEINGIIQSNSDLAKVSAQDRNIQYLRSIKQPLQKC